MTEEKPRNTVLLADDDMNLIQGICRRMRNEGFNLIVALDGYQAVQLARKHEPDVMVLDIHMPAGDGFSVRERVESLPGLAGIPTIYITGDRSKQAVEDAANAGATSMLFKPFDTDRLVESIRGALEGVQA